MSALDPRQLPSDPQVLREMVVALSAQLEEHERRLQRVQHIMEQLLAWRFGSRRERVVDERQLFLFAVEFEAQGGDGFGAVLMQPPQRQPYFARASSITVSVRPKPGAHFFE